MSPTAAERHADSGAGGIGAAASPLPLDKWHTLAEGVLRDAGGSLPSVRKLAKRLAKASKKVAPAGVSSDALKAAARAFVDAEASSSSGRGFLAVAADDSVSLAVKRTGEKKEKKNKRKSEDADAVAADAEDDGAGKSLSKKAKKKQKKRAEREEAAEEVTAADVATAAAATTAAAAANAAAPPPTTPAAAAAAPPTRQLRLPAPVTLASPRIPSGESAPQAAAAASAAAAAPETLPRWRASAARTDAKKGRLSSAEKERLVAAAKGFARSKGLSTEDLSWLFETRTGASKDLSRGAWNAVAAALPERTAKSVYAAGTRLLHPGNYRGAWTEEEIARLRELVAARGNRWVEVGGALGRLPEACRDKWKELAGGGGGGGGRGGGGASTSSSSSSALARAAPTTATAFNSKRWAPDEVERLERAVRADLATKAAAAAAFAGGDGEEGGEGGGGGRGAPAAAAAAPASAPPPPLPPAGVAASVVGARAVLDGVNWSLVSSRGVKTRSPLQCMEKWYTQVSPSMQERGDWGRGDDKRLLRALLELLVVNSNSSGGEGENEEGEKAVNASTVDWSRAAPPGRTAAAARRRWRLMLKTVPNSHELEFGEAVREIAGRSAPKLLEQLFPRGGSSAAAEAAEEEEEE